jgi:hypothetical protein
MRKTVNMVPAATSVVGFPIVEFVGCALFMGGVPAFFGVFSLPLLVRVGVALVSFVRHCVTS